MERNSIPTWMKAYIRHSLKVQMTVTRVEPVHLEGQGLCEPEPPPSPDDSLWVASAKRTISAIP